MMVGAGAAPAYPAGNHCSRCIRDNHPTKTKGSFTLEEVPGVVQYRSGKNEREAARPCAIHFLTTIWKSCCVEKDQ